MGHTYLLSATPGMNFVSPRRIVVTRTFLLEEKTPNNLQIRKEPQNYHLLPTCENSSTVQLCSVPWDSSNYVYKSVTNCERCQMLLKCVTKQQFLLKKICPLVWLSGCHKPGHQFNSQSRHMPKLWAGSLVRGMQEAANQ